MTNQQAAELNSLKLAHIGDAVHTLFVRENMLKTEGRNMSIFARECNKLCNAAAQEKAYFKFLEIATQQEKEIAMRGRNATMHHKAKNYSIEAYRHATAFEAVVGYLYLTGQTDRLNLILQLSTEAK